MRRPWEVVATWDGGGPALDGHVVPISEGRLLCWTWPGARLLAAKRNHRERRRPVNHLPPLRWIVRRPPRLTPTERQQADRVRAVLEQTFRALAFQYGGTVPSQHTEPEDVVGCEAMHAAARVLGK